MDEHTLSETGTDDAAIGTALLMADLEAAIASAGDEIAALRSVADGAPRARPALAESAGPPPVAAEPDEARAESEREEPPPRDLVTLVAAVPVAAPALPAGTARIAAAGLPERDAATGGTEALPASAAADPPNWGAVTADRAQTPPLSVAAPGAVPSWPVARPDSGESRSSIDLRAVVSRADTAAGTVAPTPGRLADTTTRGAAPAIPETRAGEAADWVWPAEAAAAPLPAAGAAATGSQPATPVFEPVAGRAAAPVGASLAERPAQAAGGAARDGELAATDRDRGGSPEPSHGGPTEGDVFLDGERVGRWMARHLARELGGPAVSGTAFDPRTGPAWPGALHGN